MFHLSTEFCEYQLSRPIFCVILLTTPIKHNLLAEAKNYVFFIGVFISLRLSRIIETYNNGWSYWRQLSVITSVRRCRCVNGSGLPTALNQSWLRAVGQWVCHVKDRENDLEPNGRVKLLLSITNPNPKNPYSNFRDGGRLSMASTQVAFVQCVLFSS